ncbi:VOC family protein [Mesorhizobium sp. YIM 152430]|uniref:VOC family protein n=1 Tax=Mesorhizobium sp. YIM 152430 TaxID=3031761 RepID=UPI0023DBA9C8|nr:VOC family protein [Mesorhizobium sp. YIM 152430]MDF1599952.1 VOC family protein [Mesorhizobium sp. YIM 152430]
MTLTLRLLDHCVLPVPDLATARARYEALGFTVAPQGTHPFGTINSCVYFADDTFLEPLAIGDAIKVAEAIESRNVFVARDALYRQAVGADGFSALVFKTDDAMADHAGFDEADFSAGPVLDFSRAFVDPKGRSGKVSFRLAFAAEPTSDAAYFFTCQRIEAPALAGRAALETHRNGVAGIAGVTLTAVDPQAQEAFLSTLANGPVGRANGALSAHLGNSRLAIEPADGPLRLAAIHFAVADIDATAEALAAGDVVFEREGGKLTVRPASGQGAIFTFEDRS